MNSDVAYLIKTDKEKDEDGFYIEKEEKIEIFVTEKSIARNEFYLGLQSGYSIKTILQTRNEDFELGKNENGYANKIEYKGEIYEILRTYTNNLSMIEIICK